MFVVYKKVCDFGLCNGIGEHVEGVNWRTYERAKKIF
jgi:hypothetical protein